MPAYRLHHSLDQDNENFVQNVMSGGGGYFHNSNRLVGGGPALGGGYYASAGAPNGMGGVGGGPGGMPEWQANEREQIGGKIKYSFYVSDTTTGRPGLAPDAALFSSSSNKPFCRQDMNPTPTPYGLLHLSALYDESLNVNRVLKDRTNRLIHWSQTRMRHAETNPNPFASRAIPIHLPKPPLTDHHGNDLKDHHESSSSRPSSYRTLPPRITDQNGGIHPMLSLPNPPPIQLGTSAPASNQTGGIQPARRQRLGSDPLKPSGLSGIGLALRESSENLESGDHVGRRPRPNTPTTKPKLEDGVSSASWEEQKQRAFHQPPPTMEHPLPEAYSPNPYKDSASHLPNSYGKGYYNPVIRNLSSSPMTVHSFGGERDNVPNSPMPLIHTPPQPSFIPSKLAQKSTEGSLPMRLSPRRSSLDQPSLSSPPFQNPFSLNPAPSVSSKQSDDGSYSEDAVHQIGIDRDLLLPPLTSFDAGLSKNPFVPKPQSSQNITASPFASLLTMGMGSLADERQEDGFPSTFGAGVSSTASAFDGAHSRSGNGSMFRNGGGADFHGSNGLNHDAADEMTFPFAEDEVEPQITPGTTFDSAGLAPPGSSTQLQMGASSAVASSQVISSLARKCATAAPLNLFSETISRESQLRSNSTRENEANDAGDSLSLLSKQLDDFRSFGASLTGNSLLQPSSTSSAVET